MAGHPHWTSGYDLVSIFILVYAHVGVTFVIASVRCALRNSRVHWDRHMRPETWLDIFQLAR